MVEPLDISILLGLARLDVIQPYSLLRSSCDDGVADVFRTVVAAMGKGLPRHSITRSSVRMTRSAGNEKSISMESASRLKSLMTLSRRNDGPSSKWSCMKSMDQDWLMPRCSSTGPATRQYGRSRSSTAAGNGR